MTPAEFLAMRPVPRALALDHAVREVCRALPAGKEINTNQMLEALHPAVTGEIEEVQARARIFRALGKLHEGVPEIAADCRHRGRPRRGFYGNVIRPWIWHRSMRT